MKKLSSKIISGLAASLIGLSPIMSTQVSAMWQPPIHQQNPESCSKDELIAMLPDLLKRLLDDMGNISEEKDDQYDYIFFQRFLPAIGEEVHDVASSMCTYGEFTVNYVNAWRINGAAYELVKDYDRQYFENLVKELIKEINLIKILMDQDLHDLDLAL